MRKMLLVVLTMVFMLIPIIAMPGEVSLTSDGKVPGTPFKVLQDQIDQLKLQLQNIQLTPGPQGIQGIAGPQGIQGDTGIGIQGIAGVQGIQGIQGIQGEQGLQGEQGDPATTEVPENDYVYVTNVNSGWVIVPVVYSRPGEGIYDLLFKPDGRPYSNVLYVGFWQRHYYYKLRCAYTLAYKDARYPVAMGGALAFPGIEMCP